MGKIFSYRKTETEWLSLGKEAKASHLDVKVTNSGFLYRAPGLEYYVRPLLNSCVDSALFSFRTNTFGDYPKLVTTVEGKNTD